MPSIAATRATCTRHAFQGCAGDGGPTCRHCPAAPMAEPEPAPMGTFERTLVAAIIIIAALGLVVGNDAMIREAGAHHMARN
jgi:hypothetical protein